MDRAKLSFLNPGGGPEQLVGGRKITGDRSTFRLLQKVLRVEFFRHASSVRRFDPFRNATLKIRLIPRRSIMPVTRCEGNSRLSGI